MPILENASIQDRKRLLELFPSASIKESWPEIKGTKEEVCFAVAQEASPAEAITFITANLGRCKQHVYIFDRPAQSALPEAIAGGEKIHTNAAHDQALYLVRTKYTVVLKDPLEEVELDFLWPFQIQLKTDHLVVRFVSLEKDVNHTFRLASVMLFGKASKRKPCWTD